MTVLPIDYHASDEYFKQHPKFYQFEGEKAYCPKYRYQNEAVDNAEVSACELITLDTGLAYLVVRLEIEEVRQVKSACQYAEQS